MTILVIGGTGLIGSDIMRNLVSRGHAVRATSRRPVAFPAGIETARVDLADPLTLRRALVGVRSVFSYVEPGAAEVLADELRRAGIGRLVLLSSSDAASNDMTDFNSRRHREAEIVIEQSRLDWTFLRPVAFASNALFWKEQIGRTGSVRAPYPNAQQSVIDPRDVADVAAEALVSPRLVGAAPMLTGPESLTQLRQVEILGAALGRSIALHPITPDETRAMLARFVAPEYIELKLTALARAERHPDPVTDAVQHIMGRAPRSFGDWAEANLAAFV